MKPPRPVYPVDPGASAVYAEAQGRRWMCGIAGFVGGALSPAERARTLSRMIDTLALRGPDDQAQFDDDSASIGMARLSIIDLAGGMQPIPNADRSRWVIQNGEVYNYESLAAELKSAGYSFRTKSDTEVQLHGYSHWGAGVLQRLRGMYAFAVWDAKERRLFAAVDRLGIKPLYWARGTDGGLVFGSELKTVLASGRVTREIDSQALALYLTYGTIPAPYTIWKGVQKLPAAHQLEWQNGEVKVSAYWDIPQGKPSELRGPALVEAVRAKLDDAVSSHMIADVPVGAFLSGGMDSSTVVALAARRAKGPLKTFTIGFPEKDYDERALAKQVAQRYGTEHHELVIEPESVDILPKLLAYFDEPFADSSAVPTYYVSKLARQHVKVALSGDGGDETFLGYNYFKSTRLAARLSHMPRLVRGALQRSVRGIPDVPYHRLNAKWSLARKRVADILDDPLATYVGKQSTVPRREWVGLLRPDLLQGVENAHPEGFVERLVESRSDNPRDLDRYAYASLKFALVSDMLVKVDRMSMMNSLEVRVPMLDHELVEFVSSIPVEERLAGGRLKGLMRDAMADALPKDILHAPKTGFSMPVAKWFRGDVAGLLRDLSGGDSPFLAGGVDKLLRRIRVGEAGLGGTLWTVLAFETWRKNNNVTL